MEILIYNSPAERKFCFYALPMVLLVFGQWFVLYKHFANYVLRIFSDMPLIFFAQFIRIDRLTVFYYNFAGDIFGKCASKMLAELLIAIGMIGQLALVAILKLPSWKEACPAHLYFCFGFLPGKYRWKFRILLCLLRSGSF